MIAAAAARRNRKKKEGESGGAKWGKLDIAKFRDTIKQRKADMTEEKRQQLETIKRKMSPEIKVMLSDMFAAYDDDSSGFLSRAEIHQAITKDLGLHVSDDELDSWLSVADADGSDVIDQDEWLILMAEAMEPKKTGQELLHAMKTIASAGPEIRSDGTMDSDAFRSVMLDILPSHGVEIGTVNEMLHYIFEHAAQDGSHKSGGNLSVQKCIEILTSRPDLFSPVGRLTVKLTPLRGTITRPES